MDLNGWPLNIHFMRPTSVSLRVKLEFLKSWNTAFHLAPNLLKSTTIKHMVQFHHIHSVRTIHGGKRTVLLPTEELALSVLKSPLKIIPFPILLHFFPLVIPRLVSVQEPQKTFLTK